MDFKAKALGIERNINNKIVDSKVQNLTLQNITLQPNNGMDVAEHDISQYIPDFHREEAMNYA